MIRSVHVFKYCGGKDNEFAVSLLSSALLPSCLLHVCMYIYIMCTNKVIFFLYV